MHQPLTRPLSAALLTSSLLILSACSGGAAPAVEVPWPHSMAGYDTALVEALEEARGVVLASPGDAASWVDLGMLFEAHLQLELAESCYGEAVRLDGSAPRSWYRLAAMRGKNGRVAEALDALARVEELEPGYAPAWRRKGWLLLADGRPGEAGAAFERAASIDPTDSVAQLGRVESELEAGDAVAALARLDRLVGIAPSSQAFYHRLRGRALSGLGRFEEAEPELARGRGARVGGADPWMREVNALKVGESAILLRAERMIEGGQAAAAVELLRGLEARDPDDPRVFKRKGRALARVGDWPGAAVALSRASELDPADRGLALASASAMVNAGDGEGALLAANRLLEIDPGFADAHELRAEMLLVLGKPAQVSGAIEAAGEQGIETVGLAVTAGKAALELEDFGGARVAFERALELDEGSSDALAGRALSCLELGAREAAASSVASLRSVDPDHPLLGVLEEALAAGGER